MIFSLMSAKKMFFFVVFLLFSVFLSLFFEGKQLQTVFNNMKPKKIIQKYYTKDSRQYKILIKHSKQVRNKALKIVDSHPELGADRQFVKEAAMLHDIGIFKTFAPKIHCWGTHRYIAHGYLGAEILRAEGYPKHALVCERHTGVGITLKRIIKDKLPIPHRDMRPVSIEEQIICYADKFYSKSRLDTKLKKERIIKKIEKFGKRQVNTFLDWDKRFS